MQQIGCPLRPISEPKPFLDPAGYQIKRILLGTGT